MVSVLGVDVGGTKMAVGPVDRTGTQLASPLVARSQTSDVNSFVAGLEALLRRALREFDEFEPVAIGVACAGTVDAAQNEIVSSPNLPLVHVPLGGMLREALKLPVVLENDANAAALGEAVCGAAKGMRDVVMVTLGTGVGGGLVLGGRLYRGANGGAGELGHMVVEKDGLACHCGNAGCLEMYASGPALARHAAAIAGDPASDADGSLAGLRARGELTGGAVSRLALDGHVGALQAVAELSAWLGVGLISLTNAFDPQMIVVGGGVSELKELLLGPAREAVRRGAMPPGREKVQIAFARLGNQAGVVGGALSAWEELERGMHAPDGHEPTPAATAGSLLPQSEGPSPPIPRS